MSDVKASDVKELSKLLLSPRPDREDAIQRWLSGKSPEFGNDVLAAVAEHGYSSALGFNTLFWLLTQVVSLLSSPSHSRLYPFIASIVILTSAISAYLEYRSWIKSGRLRVRAARLLLARLDGRCLRFLALSWSARTRCQPDASPSIAQLLSSELTRLLSNTTKHEIAKPESEALEQLFRRVWRTNRFGDLTEEQADLMLAVAHYLVAANDRYINDSLCQTVQKPALTPYRILVQETIASLMARKTPALSLSFGSAVQPAPSITVVGQRNTIP